MLKKGQQTKYLLDYRDGKIKTRFRDRMRTRQEHSF